MATRLAALETRIGAVSMMMARGPEATKQLGEFERVIGSLREVQERLASAERRVAELEKKP